MDALVYTGPEALEMRAMPDPVAGNGEVLVHIRASGICGSDMHAFLGHDDRRPAPLILGHEAAGVTEAGRRVTINPLVACGHCPACQAGRDNICPDRQIISMPPRHGAFAPRVAVPAANLVEIPDDMTFAQAALAEPIACGWHAVRLGLAGLDTCDTALVLGGGAIGLGAALSLDAQAGCAVTLVEPNAVRRDYLNSIGQHAVAAPPEGAFDLVVDGVGYAATRAAASAAARSGGMIVHIGLGASEGGLDIRRLTLQEITFIGTYTYTSEDFRATVREMADGSLGALDWTEARPLTTGLQAFLDIRAGTTARPKLTLIPEET